MALLNSCVGSSDSGLWAQLDDSERRQERGAMLHLKLWKKLVCTCLGFPWCWFIPVNLDAWGKRCRLWVRSFNPAGQNQECGNQHQPGFECFVKRETWFQQLGVEFEWPHVNISEFSFPGKKKKSYDFKLIVASDFKWWKGEGECV